MKDSSNSCFRDCHEIFERYQGDFSTSKEFEEVGGSIQRLLTLADRLLFAIENEEKSGLAAGETRRCLEKIADGQMTDPDTRGYDLLCNVLEGF